MAEEALSKLLGKHWTSTSFNTQIVLPFKVSKFVLKTADEYLSPQVAGIS